MLVVGKTRPIRVEGDVSEKLLALLREEYGELEVYEEADDELIDSEESVVLRETRAGMRPGDYIRIDRENMDLTQEQLGVRLGRKSRQYVSDLEAGRRSVSKAMAIELSRVFDRPVDRYLIEEPLEADPEDEPERDTTTVELSGKVEGKSKLKGRPTIWKKFTGITPVRTKEGASLVVDPESRYITHYEVVKKATGASKGKRRNLITRRKRVK